MIPHIPVFPTGVHGSRNNLFVNHRPAHGILVKEQGEHASLGDGIANGGYTGGIGIGWSDHDLVRAVDALPEVDSLHVSVFQIVIMEGVSQYTGVNLVAILSEHIHFLFVIGRVPGHGFTSQRGLIAGGHFSEQGCNTGNPAIHPLHKGGIIVRLENSSGSQRQSGQRIVFGQKVNVPGSVVFSDQTADEIGNESTGHILLRQFNLVAHVSGDHGQKLSEFCGVAESGFKLIFEHGVVVSEHALAEEVGLYEIPLIDNPVINAQSVASGVASLGSIESDRILIGIIVFPV